MKIKSKYFIIGLFLMVIACFYYYVQGINSYSFNFKINRPQISMYYTILNLDNLMTDSIEIKNIYSHPYNGINQGIKAKNVIPSIINWKIIADGDSISKIQVTFRFTHLSFKEKLNILINQSQTKQFYREKMNDFFKFSEQHKDNYKVKNYKKIQNPELFGYAISLKGKREDKAILMIHHIHILDEFFVKNGIEIEGKPFLRINKWDIKSDSIWFDFAFPSSNKHIKETDEVKKIYISSRPSQAIEFYGNYGISDQAWFYLHQKKIKSLKNYPIEVFYDNPKDGGNEKDWKAVVYIQE